MDKLETQVLIIGAGTTGGTIGRELSKYKVDAILVDRREFPGLEETKASHGFIYGGGLTAAGSLVMKSVMLPSGQTAYNPDSRKNKMEHESFKEFPQIAEELDVSLSHDRRIMLAKNQDDIKMLRVADDICKQMG